jgi:hypothetical protein
MPKKITTINSSMAKVENGDRMSPLAEVPVCYRASLQIAEGRPVCDISAAEGE